MGVHDYSCFCHRYEDEQCLTIYECGYENDSDTLLFEEEK